MVSLTRRTSISHSPNIRSTTPIREKPAQSREPPDGGSVGHMRRDVLGFRNLRRRARSLFCDQESGP